MYQTFRARIDNGHVVFLEMNNLPEKANALVTIVSDKSPSQAKPSVVRLSRLLGKIKIKLIEEPMSWQTRIRSEWN